MHASTTPLRWHLRTSPLSAMAHQVALHEQFTGGKTTTTTTDWEITRFSLKFELQAVIRVPSLSCPGNQRRLSHAAPQGANAALCCLRSSHMHPVCPEQVCELRVHRRHVRGVTSGLSSKEAGAARGGHWCASEGGGWGRGRKM
jgi:hypothetical protein